MTTFEEQFPSLKEWMFEQGISSDIQGTNNMMKSIINEHCLDKQRVKETIDKFFDALESQTDDWDYMCDCNVDERDFHEDKYGHDSECMTMKIRKDYQKLLKELGL